MRVKDADAIQMGVYYEALGAFTLERVRDAALEWTQTGRFFPTTGEWVTLIHEMETQVPVTPWSPTVTVSCEVCSDTGFQYRDCEPGSRCGRKSCLTKSSDWRHPYVARCPCFTSDPK